MSLLYDSHDSRVLREHGAASEAGLNGPQHPGSQGNVETFKLMSFFSTFTLHTPPPPPPSTHRFIRYTSRYAFAWTCLDLEVYSAPRLFVSIKKTTRIHEVPKRRRASKWTCFVPVFFLSLFIYVFYQNVIQMEGWAFAWQQGWGAEREPQGETVSINRSWSPPPHPYILQYSSYGLTNAYIARRIPQHCVLNMTIKRGRLAVCIAILAG